MVPARRPTPGPFAPPTSSARRPAPDSDHPQPLAESVLLTCPGGDHTLTVGRVLIGRAASCQVVLVDPLVSREHALLRIGLKDVFIEDLGSANGVYVNNVRISEPHQLSDGDRILLGTQELCVFAVSSRRQQRLPSPPTEGGTAIGGGHDAATERLAPGVVLGRVARQMFELGAPGEAERILGNYLRQTLDVVQSGRPLARAACTEAAHHALTLANALGSGRWLDYTVDLHYRARHVMSLETATALAETAARVSDVDRVALARYVMWVETNRDPERPDEESVLGLLEALR